MLLLLVWNVVFKSINNNMKFPDDLLPGDMIGYNSQSFIMRVETWKTDGLAGHVVVYIGNGQTITAQPKGGVDYYPFEADNVVWVRRPKAIFDLDQAGVWFKANALGEVYGWTDIEIVSGVQVGTPKGMDCSHTVAAFLEAGGAPQFDIVFDKSRITPRDFELSFESTPIWTAP